jgi:hypothetical protein
VSTEYNSHMANRCILTWCFFLSIIGRLPHSTERSAPSGFGCSSLIPYISRLFQNTNSCSSVENQKHHPGERATNIGATYCFSSTFSDNISCKQAQQTLDAAFRGGRHLLQLYWEHKEEGSTLFRLRAARVTSRTRHGTTNAMTQSVFDL